MKHEFRVLTVDEVMNGRSSAYEFIDVDKLVNNKQINNMAEKATTTAVEVSTPTTTKPKSTDYQTGFDDGIRATVNSVVNHLDTFITSHGSTGYVEVLKQLRSEIENINY